MIEPVRKCMVVLGMHRSGTSALAGSLQIMGVDMGSEHLEASADNPKGFFEHKGIVNINDAILDSLRSSWDDPFLLSGEWWKSSDLDAHRKTLEGIISRDYRNGRLFGFKDPRISRLLPFWQDILDKLEISVRYVILLRNPLEVAQSLKKRNGFSIGKSLLIWAHYMLDAELYTRNSPRIFVSYDAFLVDPVGTINTVSDRLGIGFPRSVSEALPDLASFLELGLRHHSSSVIDLNEQAWTPIAQLFGVLSAAAERGGATPEQRQWLDSFRRDFIKINEYFCEETGPQRMRDLKAQIEALEAEKRGLEADLARIVRSVEWSLFGRYYEWRNRLFPEGSRRRKLAGRAGDFILRKNTRVV